MDIALKQKWIESLRSGKYEQGQYALKCNDKFCCLGVLCDIIDSTKWLPTKWDLSIFTFDEVYDLLPSTMCNLLHEDSDISAKLQSHLAKMNDGGDILDECQLSKSFNEIADWIEQNV